MSLVNVKLFLAPLAGFTNAAFRRVCANRGADLAYTEMVSAAGLFHGSSPTRQLMEVLPGEGPVACQIFGSKPEELAFAARLADGMKRFTEINLNAGCPMPKIMHEGDGAALLKDPAKVHECLVAMKRETSLPVTLKTRPGPKPDKVLLFELLDAAQTAGAAGFILHARFTSQMHGGEVHLDLLSDCVRAAKIPVTGNGSVCDLATAEAMVATGVKAIMIGRAAMSSPWLFEDLHSREPEEALVAPERRRTLQENAFREHLESLLELREQLAEHFPNDHIPSEDGFVNVALHTHLFRYFNGRPGAAQLRRRLAEIRTLDEIFALCGN